MLSTTLHISLRRRGLYKIQLGKFSRVFCILFPICCLFMAKPHPEVEDCLTPLERYNELPVDLILHAAALLSAKEQVNTIKKSHKRPCKVEGCSLRSARYGLCGKHGGKERCKHPGCDKFEYKAGLCQLHGGPKWRYKKPCLTPGCQLAAYGRGLCSRHGGVDKCCVPGCGKNDRGGGYCMAHRDMQVRHVVSDASDTSVGSSMGSQRDGSPSDTNSITDFD